MSYREKSSYSNQGSSSNDPNLIRSASKASKLSGKSGASPHRSSRRESSGLTSRSQVLAASNGHPSFREGSQRSFSARDRSRGSNIRRMSSSQSMVSGGSSARSKSFRKASSRRSMVGGSKIDRHNELKDEHLILEEGSNVTPKPLASSSRPTNFKLGSGLMNAMNSSSSAADHSSSMAGHQDAGGSSFSLSFGQSSASLYDFDKFSSTASLFSGRSISSNGSVSPDLVSENSVSSLNGDNYANFGGLAGKPGAGGPVTPGGPAESHRPSSSSGLQLDDNLEPVEKLYLSEEQLEEPVFLQLSETPTMWMLNIPGTSVAMDGPEAESVTAANARYKELKKSRLGNENFVERGMQTFNQTRKERGVQVHATQTSSVGVNSSVWDIYDSHNVETEEGAKAKKSVSSGHEIGVGTSTDGLLNVVGADGLLAPSVGVGAQERNGDGSFLDASDMVSVRSGRSALTSMASFHTARSVDSSSQALGGGAGQQSMGFMSSRTGGSVAHDGLSAGLAEDDREQVSIDHLPNIISNLRILERSVTQNLYHDKQVKYRNMTVLSNAEQSLAEEVAKIDISTLLPEGAVADASTNAASGSTEGVGTGVGLGSHLGDTKSNENQDPNAVLSGSTGAGDEGVGLKPSASSVSVVGGGGGGGGVSKYPGIEYLWTFESEAVSGKKNVSAVCWNQKNPDLLAVGYGSFDFTHGDTGFILCWSLKNPAAPERIIPLSSGVSSLDFSTSSANLLAAGLYDGTIAVFDLRREDYAVSLVDSSQLAGKHSEPVWQVKWTDGGSERGDNLVSMSTDGRVTKWSIKKGLEWTDLMKLKRITNQAKSDGKTEAFISRLASGLCFDFSSRDSNIYIAGTEDGVIHKCSVSYNEQYLSNYFGHSGPVYAIKWSPWADNIFLSASADWSVKLWREEEEAPVLSFSTTSNAVVDVAWAPNLSTVFAYVTTDGSIELWDLRSSALDPVISHKEKSRKFSCVSFSQNSPVLVTGDDKGAVNVYKLNNIVNEGSLTHQDNKENQSQEEGEVEGEGNKENDKSNLQKSLLLNSISLHAATKASI